jgi:hypothetical protein
MKEWLIDVWAAARLRTDVIAALARKPDAFLHGTIIIIVVALLIGIPGFVHELSQVSRAGQVTEPAETRTALRDALEAVRPTVEELGIPAGIWTTIEDQIVANFGLGSQIGQQIEQLPTALPRPVGRFLRTLGHWLSTPFTATGLPLAVVGLAGWLGYGIWVMLAAKLLGGRATLHGFFGATALYAVPHVLDAFRWLPFIGGLLGFIALLWGAVVYIKATQVSHEFTFERALLAVLLPVIVLIGVGVLVISILRGVAAFT